MRKLIKLGTMLTVAVVAAVVAFPVQALITNADIANNAGISYSKLKLSKKITSKDIKNGTIKGDDIDDEAIDTDQLADGAVTTAKLADDTIVAGDIATGAVTTTEILDGTILTGDISADTILAADIATGAVATAEILDGTILVGDLADGAVTSAKILDETIASADILDGTIGADDIAAAAVTASEIADETITTTEILNGTIASADIAVDTIAAVDIAADGVATSEILDETILSADIFDGTITAADLGADSVAASELADSSVDTGAIVTGAVTAVKLQSAAADLGAANVTVNLGNTNGAFVTNVTTDGTITGLVVYSSGGAFDATTGGTILHIGETFATGGIILDQATTVDGLLTAGAGLTVTGDLKANPQSAAGTAAEGTIYYDSDDDNLYVYANGAFVDLTAGAAGAVTLDDAYNFGSGTETEIHVDTGNLTLSSEDTTAGGGDIMVDLTSTGDFVVQNAGVAFATFDDSGNVAFTGTLGVTGATTATGVVNANGGIANTDAEDLAINANAAQKIILGGTSTGDIDLTRNTNALAGLDVTGALTVTTTSDLQGNVSDSLGTFTIDDAANVTGAVTLDGAVTLGNAAADVVTVTGTVAGANPLVFEGLTAGDGFEITLAVADAGADATVTVPATTGTLVTTGDTATVTSLMIGVDTIAAVDIVAGGVATSEILDATILEGDMADLAVTSAKIAADTIVAGDIADGAVATGEILDGTILTGDISVDTILAVDIATDAVGTAEILDSTITTTDIAAGTIIAGDIAADAIDGASLADTITLDAALAINGFNVSFDGDINVNGDNVNADGTLVVTGATGLTLAATLGNATMTGATDASVTGTAGDVTLTSGDDLLLNPTDDITATLAAAGSVTVNATTTPNTTTTGVIAMNVGAGDAAVDGLNIAMTQNDGATAAVDATAAEILLTGNDANGDVFGLTITGAATANAAAGTYEAGISINNAEDAVGSMTDGIVIAATTDTATTDAIDVSDAELVNAINVGANVILGTTAVINFDNFDVDANGEITAASDLIVNGDEIDADGTLDITGATGLNLNSTAGDIVLDPAGNNVNPGTDVADSLGENATRWATIFADTLNFQSGLTDSASAGGDAGNATITLGNDSALDTVNVTANTAITDAQWSVTAAGVANFASVGATAATAGTFTTLIGDTVQADTTLTFSTNGDSVNNSTDATFDFTRNDTGIVTITASDDDATADLSISGGGAGDLNLGDADSDVDVVGDLTVGGGSGDSGVTISSAGAITADSTITASGTLDANGIVTLGDNGENVTIDSNVWDVTGAGVASGLTGITSTGAVDFSGATSVRIAIGAGIATTACDAAGEVGKVYYANTTANGMTSGLAYVCVDDADSNGTNTDFAWEALN